MFVAKVVKLSTCIKNIHRATITQREAPQMKIVTAVTTQRHTKNHIPQKAAEPAHDDSGPRKPPSITASKEHRDFAHGVAKQSKAAQDRARRIVLQTQLLDRAGRV